MIDFIESEFNCKLSFLRKLTSYILDENGGMEFIHPSGIDTLINFIEKDFIKLGIDVKKLSQDEIKNLESNYKKSNEIIYSDFFNNLEKQTFNLYIKPKGLHQIELLQKLDQFKKDKIGQLIWSCGLGKTFASLFIAHKLNRKKILICVPSIYILLQFKKSVETAFNIKPICLYSKSSNKKKIKEVINNNIIIIISTYHSCKLILDESLQLNFKFDIKIGDEAHHLVTEENEDSAFTFDKFHKIPSEYTLFMTATQKEIINKNKLTYTMSDTNIFGNIIDKKNIFWAIKNNYITDYNIICIMNSDDEISSIYNSINLKVSCKDTVIYNKKELLLAAYNGLKCINDKLVTHILIYTNKKDTADIVQQIINILIEKNIFENININNIYNKSLHSNTKNDLNKEVNQFKLSEYGIISCVYIFGEGFDLPKLNGVVIGEQMTSDIRIVQSCLRPNRKEEGNEDKKAYIIIPTNINNIDDKIKIVVREMIKEDSHIIQKIQFKKTIKRNTSELEINNKLVNIKNNEYLARLKINLFSSGCFGKKMLLEDEYNYHKELIKSKNLKTIKDYNNHNYLEKISNPNIYFFKIWKNWFDYLSINTKIWIKNKTSWIKYCKENNIHNVYEYYNKLHLHNCLPPEPEHYYNNFTNIDSELNYRKFNYINRN